jgi:hypothetical protein
LTSGGGGEGVFNLKGLVPGVTQLDGAYGESTTYTVIVPAVKNPSANDTPVDFTNVVLATTGEKLHSSNRKLKHYLKETLQLV